MSCIRTRRVEAERGKIRKRGKEETCVGGSGLMGVCGFVMYKITVLFNYMYVHLPIW